MPLIRPILLSLGFISLAFQRVIFLLFLRRYFLAITRRQAGIFAGEQSVTVGAAGSSADASGGEEEVHPLAYSKVLGESEKGLIVIRFVRGSSPSKARVLGRAGDFLSSVSFA